jgi:hypothetical protein
MCDIIGITPEWYDASKEKLKLLSTNIPERTQGMIKLHL